MDFVQTYRNGGREVYLPGSSLKGVFRSQAERIVRTLTINAKGPCVCVPFENDKNSKDCFCGHRFQEEEKAKGIKLKTARVYKDSCPICKIFGSTYFTGRFSISDAYSCNGTPMCIQRDGVGIDRFTGGASHGAKFNLEVVTEGTFETRIHIRNFELWQLGLLAYLIQDLMDELIWIGSGKSRGLGRIKGEIVSASFSFIKPLHALIQGEKEHVGSQEDAPGETGNVEIYGLGEIIQAPEHAAYGFVPNDCLRAAGEVKTRGIRQVIDYTPSQFETILPRLAQKWDEFIQDKIDEMEVEAHG